MVTIMMFRKFRKLASIAIGALIAASVMVSPTLQRSVHADSVTSTVTVGNAPSAIAVDSNSEYVYVANFADKTVSYWNSAASPISVKSVSGFRNGPTSIAVKPGNSEVWVTVGGLVQVFNQSGITQTIDLPGTDIGNWISFDPAGDTAYVSIPESKEIVTITTSDYTVNATTYTVGQFPVQSIVLDISGTNYLFVADNGSDAVSVVNTSTGAVSTVSDSGGTIEGDEYMATDGSNLYTANQTNSSVSVINASTKTVTKQITNAGIAYAIAYAQTASAKKLFITDYAFETNELQIYNLSSSSFETPITSGFNDPVAITARPDGKYVFVANNGSNYVSVITTN